LGKNIGKYLGEAIDIRAVMRDVETAAQQHGWKSEAFLQTPELRLLALTRPAASAPAHRIYLSTGIHGDEPAGPLAALRLLQENPWPQNAELWLCPCLNPTGFPLNRRENAAGTDLNRQYLKPQAPETRAHVAWLGRQPNFDVCLCLHEDWESNGFYLYELNPENRPSYAEAIVKTVAAVCPVDQSSTIEGRDASGGIIRPSVDPRSRPDWPEAFYLLSNKTRLSYTLEAPSDFPLATRVDALVAGVRAVLEIFKPSS
jgi:predicted deacylase